ncbi:hypothetical protein HK100_009043 [Physocladia obscura]|uniref:Phytanoyl-CoA dioxygenase n=1 Tax=Physocladia obscura TaxID=109957 RepID=A0AAD5SNP3_9FUNG|nr:hypothetical protein HK100_009043 [Physocladia obscura]
MTTREPETYRFDLDNDKAWLNHLETEGFAVIKCALEREEITKAHSELWAALELFPSRDRAISRGDPTSWSLLPTGICGSLAQSQAAWTVRGSRGVKTAFTKIWKTDDLIVSMDAVITWKPWWGFANAKNEAQPSVFRSAFSSIASIFGSNPTASTPLPAGFPPYYKPRGEIMHLDQNPFKKRFRDCVQGMVPLLPVTREIGGLIVVPHSHNDEMQDRIRQQQPQLEGGHDFCPIFGFSKTEDALLLIADAGDLILWDSRTIHGSLAGDGPVALSNEMDFARMTCTVAMTPRACASKEVLQARREGFLQGKCFNHVPHENNNPHSNAHAGYVPIVLTTQQDALL